MPWDPRRRRKQPGGWGTGPGAGGVERHEIQDIQTGSDKAEASVGGWGHRQGEGWETDRQGRRTGRSCASSRAGGAWQNRGGVKGKPQAPRKEGYPPSHSLLCPLPSTLPAGTGFLCLHPHRCPVSWVYPHLTDRSEAQRGRRTWSRSNSKRHLSPGTSCKLGENFSVRVLPLPGLFPRCHLGIRRPLTGPRSGANEEMDSCSERDRPQPHVRAQHPPGLQLRSSSPL